MASKRKANDSGMIPVEKPKRRYEDPIQEEIIIPNDGDNLKIPCKCGSVVVNCSLLEDMIREVVREELQAASQNQSPRLTANQCDGISEAQRFQLRFTNKLKQAYFTQNKILAEDDKPVRIVLYDVRSQSIVKDGPMSSIKIDICALPGDFGCDGRQNWSREEFNANILQPREGKKALLMGHSKITLKEGVAFIDKIEFTDNSSWQRTRTFRLAAKSKEANVREATTDPFKVRDRRGESYMKHDQPSLNSEIWRLTHIAKSGPYRRQLSKGGIKRVKHFMRLYTTNPSLLKQKFDGISRRKWEDIIEHARSCRIDDNEHYSYRATEQLYFILNSIYEVELVSFDNGKTYRSPETFNSDEKRWVEEAKKEAYVFLTTKLEADQNVEDSIFCPVALKELEHQQVGHFNNDGAPPAHGVSQGVDVSASAAQQEQGQMFDWGLLDDSGLRSPFCGLLDDSGLRSPFCQISNDFLSILCDQSFETGSSRSDSERPLNSDAPTSIYQGPKSESILRNMIRAALILRMSHRR